MITHKSNHPSKLGIGEAWGVFIAGGAHAILTKISIHKNTGDAPLNIEGDSFFVEESVRSHWEDVIIPLTKTIAKQLDLETPAFSLELVTPGAATVDDRHVHLSGHSLDLALFLAMLSSLLEQPLKQGVVASAMMATKSGELSIVGGLPLKLEACVETDSVKEVIICDHRLDASFKEMKPAQYSDYQAATKSAGQYLKIHSISHVSESLAAAFETADLIKAGMDLGFWNRQLSEFESLPYLTQLNQPPAFINTIEELIVSGEREQLLNLFTSFIGFHLSRSLYPEGFGRDLLSLLKALPTYLQRDLNWDNIFPKRQYIQLTQSATENDLNDVSLLHDALYGRKDTSKPTVQTPVDQTPDHGLLDYLLSKLDEETLNYEIDSPFNEARASFRLNNNTYTSSEDFVSELECFIHHLSRWVPNLFAPLSGEFVTAKTLELLELSFGQDSPLKRVFEWVRTGRNGGMRSVLDKITEDQIALARKKYSLAVFTRTMDASDEDLRLSLIKAMLEKWKDLLPKDILDQSPHAFMNSYEKIILTWLDSRARFQSTINRL
jgi:hypothetical protein